MLSIAIIVGGCSQKLPKSDKLLAAEQYYQKASKDPKVSQYANTELKKANATLKAAMKTTNIEEMNALAHISKNQTGIAIKNAEIKTLSKSIEDIMTSLSEDQGSKKIKLDLNP